MYVCAFLRELYCKSEKKKYYLRFSDNDMKQGTVLSVPQKISQNTAQFLFFLQSVDLDVTQLCLLTGDYRQKDLRLKIESS